jgi:hypothetical protein
MTVTPTEMVVCTMVRAVMVLIVTPVAASLDSAENTARSLEISVVVHLVQMEVVSMTTQHWPRNVTVITHTS